LPNFHGRTSFQKMISKVSFTPHEMQTPSEDSKLNVHPMSLRSPQFTTNNSFFTAFVPPEKKIKNVKKDNLYLTQSVGFFHTSTRQEGFKNEIQTLKHSNLPSKDISKPDLIALHKERQLIIKKEKRDAKLAIRMKTIKRVASNSPLHRKLVDSMEEYSIQMTESLYDKFNNIDTVEDGPASTINSDVKLPKNSLVNNVHGFDYIEEHNKIAQMNEIHPPRRKVWLLKKYGFDHLNRNSPLVLCHKMNITKQLP